LLPLSLPPPPLALPPLSLHDALPIFTFTPSASAHTAHCQNSGCSQCNPSGFIIFFHICHLIIFSFSLFFYITCTCISLFFPFYRSEEHTSELQSRFDLVCRLLLEKKK